MCDNTFELANNTEKICKYITELKQQRDEALRLIRKQEEEKCQIEIEMERLAYKAQAVSKSLAQRIVSRERYEEAIQQAEEHYKRLVQSTGCLLTAIEKDFQDLFESMDKKVGPDVSADVSRHHF